VKILVLVFKATNTEKIAKHLQVPVDKIYIESDQDWINQFVANTDFTKYDYILGMGEYSGHDKRAIRIETECTSQFRNNKDDLQKLSIPYFLEPKSPLKLANGIGNSWCNLLSHKVLSKVPDAKFTFLHIPKTFNVGTATQAIERQLLALLS